MSLSEGPVSARSLSALRVVLLRNLRAFLVMLGWGTSFSAATLWAIFQGLLLPKATISPPSIWQTELELTVLYYLMIAGIAFLSGLCVGEMGKTIVAFTGSYVMAGIVVYAVLSAPGLNSLDIAFRESLVKLSLSWAFVALFPIPLFLTLLSGILGAGLQETIVG